MPPKKVVFIQMCRFRAIILIEVKIIITEVYDCRLLFLVMLLDYLFIAIWLS